MAALTPQQEQALEKLFQRHSKDGGDTVSRGDVLKLVQLFGLNPTQKQFEKTLGEHSLNDRDYLAIDEVKLIILANYEDNIEDELRAAFSKFDINKNGVLDPVEFEKFMCSYGEKFTPDEFKQMLAIVDLNADGQIAYEELLKAMLQPVDVEYDEGTEEEEHPEEEHHEEENHEQQEEQQAGEEEEEPKPE